MRQGDDKDYADMMSRIRIGSPTDEDIKRLMKRFITVVNDPGNILFIYFYCSIFIKKF